MVEHRVIGIASPPFGGLFEKMTASDLNVAHFRLLGMNAERS